MSPNNTGVRVKTLYVLIGLTLVALLATGGLALYVNTLHGKVSDAEHAVIDAQVAVAVAQARVQASEVRGYNGCLRGNVLREIARYAMIELGSPARAAKPEVQEQPCAQLYPGGVP